MAQRLLHLIPVSGLHFLGFLLSFSCKRSAVNFPFCRFPARAFYENTTHFNADSLGFLQKNVFHIGYKH